MGNEFPSEPTICLNLSLPRENLMFYGMKKIFNESTLRGKGYNYANQRIFLLTYGIWNNNNEMET